MAARKVVLVGLVTIAALVCLSQAAPMKKPVTMILTQESYTYAPIRDGGYGNAVPGDENAQKLADSVSENIQEKDFKWEAANEAYNSTGLSGARFQLITVKTCATSDYNLVKSDILKQAGLGASPAEFVVEKYKTQVVNGYNTSLKIRVAPGKYLHTVVYQPFSKEASPKATVSRVEANKSLQDAF